MKKTIIIFSLVILFTNLANAGLYPVSVADLIQPSCNNNGICDYFENSARCPNECQTQNINTANNIVTSTTTIPTITETPQPDLINEQINTNIENNKVPITNIVKKQPIPWNLILSIGFVIGVILLVSVLYLWIKQKQPIKTKKGKTKEIKKIIKVSEESEFGLPSRPKRGFGV
ncbi:hypothetical protein HYV88_05570 [Candidatus Woesearchaeota archaeon]|nr:hypothetical protein [Candidatus Woesearchaeota archaeon]